MKSVIPQPVIDKMPYKDKENSRERSRLWQMKMRDQMRLIMREAKDKPCMDCRHSYPYYVMQFDHVKGNKVDSISNMIQRPSKFKVDQLKEEILKCEVVCANCHALRHKGVCFVRE